MVNGALEAMGHLIATLALTVNEDGATVLVDGEAAGITPRALPLALDLGSHTLIVKKTGFETIERTIEASGGATSSLEITLRETPRVGRVLIVTDPDATITIDGRIVGNGSVDTKLSAGSHDLLVTEPGKLGYRTKVDLRPGEMRSIQATLTEKHPATIWPWLVGSALLASGTALGAYLLFRPQDPTSTVPVGTLRPGLIQFQRWSR